MSYSFTHTFTSMAQLRFKSDDPSSPTSERCFYSEDYVDLIETGSKTNILTDATGADIDDSTTYFFGIRMRVFGTFYESGGEYELTSTNLATATELSGRTFTYGSGGSLYGLGQILAQLPTAGFLTPPSSLVVPIGGYTRVNYDDFLYFADSIWDTECVMPYQEGSVISSSTRGYINMVLNTPPASQKIAMPLLYVPQAFRAGDNTYIWGYPMIYNAQGVPYGS